MVTILRLVACAMIGVVTFPLLLAGQGTGRLTGRVIDADDATPLGGAQVAIVGSSRQTTATADGRYTFRGLVAGTVTVRVIQIGYVPKQVAGVVITDGALAEQNLTLTPRTVELGEITVTAQAEQGSVIRALEEQRYSTGIISGVSREELAQSPDGDAAAAAQRLSGATVQDGKYIFVRGLGDRYTTASLNGARIPSAEPERKVVPLDLFPAALLDGITISKTFTPDQSGDFSGAAINIRTRAFPTRTFQSLSISTGYNSASTGARSAFAPTTGRDWLAAGATSRDVPAPVRAADFGSALDQSQYNSLVRSFRNVWTPINRSGSPNAATTVSLGGTTGIGSGRLGYTVSGSYSYSEEVKADQVRALAATVGSGAASEVDRFTGRTGIASVLWGAAANFSLGLGADSRLTLNNSYTRAMDNEARRETGSSENLAIPLLIERTQYVERHMRSSQLELHQGFGADRLTLDGGVTWSAVGRLEPDRSEVVYSLETGTPRWYGFSNEAAVRTFGDLREHAIEGHADVTIALGAPNQGRRLRVGALTRHANRDATNTAYAISLSRALPGDAAGQPAERLFGEWSDGNDDYFRVAPLAAGGSYTARDDLWAGYAMYSAPLSRHIDLVLGARVEHQAVTVRSQSTAGEPSTAKPVFTDLLPSFSLNWHVGENSSLRGSVTRTLSRPEYRELSPILYREVIGSDNVRGNADLRRALIRNYDLRFEFYPRRGELLSVGLFAKEFDGPIERIYQGTSGTRIISHVNAEAARNFGVEIEVRKRLDMIVPSWRALTLFANATVMHSEIRIDPTAGSVTNARRAMVGQAPYVINAGLTWTDSGKGFAATLLYNRVGERISEAGELPLPDVVIQPRDAIDLSAHLPIQGALSARVDVKNFLDARYRTSQGAVTRESYRTGRIIAVGFRWQP